MLAMVSRHVLPFSFAMFWALRVFSQASNVTVTVDFNQPRQIIAGFGGASATTLHFGSPGDLTDALRRKAIDAAFGQVGLNLGLAGTTLEGLPGAYPGSNDNNDPNIIDWSRVQGSEEDSFRRLIIDFPGTTGATAKQLGLTGYTIGGTVPNVRWGNPWMYDVRRTNYSLFIAEAAEQVLEDVSYYQRTFGEVTPLYWLGNEQLTGNSASAKDGNDFGAVSPTQQMVDLVRQAGARLRGAGFGTVKFIVGTEETEESSYALAQAILDDPVAAGFVGAIGYHTYPYGSVYSSWARILSTSGAGHPDASRIAIRAKLSALAQQHNLPLWQNENSNGQTGSPGLNALSFDACRARAIHIHDEFEYAEANAYFCQGPMWDLNSQRLHFGGSDDLFGSEAMAVLINNDSGEVVISAFGRAIGHYARWVKPGARRIATTSDDPLVQASAFLNETNGVAAFVLLNNAAQPRAIAVRLRGGLFTGNAAGEQSTSAAYWQPVPSLASTNATELTINLPPDSVTSLAIPYLVPATLNLPSLTPAELRFVLAGGIGQSYAIERSIDLVSWEFWQSITLTNFTTGVGIPRDDKAVRFFRAHNSR